MTTRTKSTSKTRSALASTNGSAQPAAKAPLGPVKVSEPSVHAGKRTTQGAHFEWTLAMSRENPWLDRRAIRVEMHTMDREAWEDHEKSGHFHAWTAVECDDGTFVVARLRCECSVEEEERPDIENRALIKPFRAALLEWLESRPDVKTIDMTVGTDGRVRFSFDLDMPEETHESPEIVLTVERGDM